LSQVPRWDDPVVTQRRPDVPAPVDRFVQTLLGASSTFEYLIARQQRLVIQLDGCWRCTRNRVVLLARPELTRLTLEVGPEADPLLFRITITADTTRGSLAAVWHHVPREQGIFGATLEGDNPHYDYAEWATGDFRALGALLLVLSDGNEALIDDRPAGPGPVEPDHSLRVGASFFCSFPTAPTARGALVPTTSKPVRAAAFQQARASGDAPVPANADGGIMTSGSSLFRATPGAPPAGGGAAQVLNPAEAGAPLTRLGTNGGWINQAEQRTLRFDWDNWVHFETDEARAPNIGTLAMPGDMSLELWCKPLRSRREDQSPTSAC
jgi:hypothetical protein